MSPDRLLTDAERDRLGWKATARFASGVLQITMAILFAYSILGFIGAFDCAR